MKAMKRYIRWFEEITKEDIPIAGGKGANLGELTQIGIPVPPGFVVTVDAYFDFLKAGNLQKQIEEILQVLNPENVTELQEAAEKIQRLIKNTPIPEEIAKQIMKAYLKLGSLGGLKQAYVAVRSSATAEDLPDASFAGQQETFLNVRGEASVVNRVRDCWASLFTPRAIFYRQKNHFDHFRVGIAVPIQKMIQSQVSGVMFTTDPITNDKNTLVCEAVWGLGELIVQGTVTPDHYCVDKKSLKITKIEVHPQKVQLIKIRGKTAKVAVPRSLQNVQKLNSLQIIELAKLGIAIQKHYFFPQDIEWGMEKNKLYILQTRPITTLKKKSPSSSKKEIKEAELFLEGEAASPGIATGPAKVIFSAKEIKKVKKGDILVTVMTSPDFVPAMQLAKGIVTDKGGQTSHAAIVSRELAIPCVVGTGKATKIIKTGEIITVDGTNGKIYRGEVKKKKIIKKKVLPKNVKTATKIYVNLGEPSLAKRVAQEKVDGVGLLRAEFIIAGIGVHPKKLLEEKRGEIFTNELAKGIAKFCRAFYPRPVVYRATDFKTNEYRHLQGGEKFEPHEENPLLGFRGAIRYITSPEVFQLELEAIKKVRNKMGLKNLWLMVPFVRTPEQLIQIKRILASVGLTRSPSFKLWMMVEIPSNVILLQDFIEAGIDGISIGSNDLTMLTLGVDRDNSEVAGVFDERNKAVLWSLRRVIRIANKNGITSSICGQAPSNYPELVEKLVRWGITSISVNPDAIERTREIVYWVERKIRRGKR